MAPIFPKRPPAGSPVMRSTSPTQNTQRSTLEGTTVQGILSSGTLLDRLSGDQAARAHVRAQAQAPTQQKASEDVLPLSAENIRIWKKLTGDPDDLDWKPLGPTGNLGVRPRALPIALKGRLRTDAAYADRRIRASTHGAVSAVNDLGVSEVWTIPLTRQATEVDDIELDELDPIQQAAQSEKFAKALVTVIFVLVLTSASTAIAILVLVQDVRTYGAPAGHIIWLVLSAATMPILIGVVWAIVSRRQKVVRHLQNTMAENLRRVVVDRDRLNGQMQTAEIVRHMKERIARDNGTAPLRQLEDRNWEDFKAQWIFLSGKRLEWVDRWLESLEQRVTGNDWEDVRGDSQFGEKPHPELNGRLDRLNAARAAEGAEYIEHLTEVVARREAEVGSIHNISWRPPPSDSESETGNKQADAR